MPLRKRIHTITSDKTSTRHNKKQKQTQRQTQRHIRRGIAAEAARIMATQAQFNFRIAKQKAAERLGLKTSVALPSNIEVEDALRAYQQFYGGQRHSRQIQKMREVALRVMRSLVAFYPRLVGPVLEGTADEHARISLHVFNDPPDAVAVYLLDRGLSYTDEQRRIRWHDGSFRQIHLLLAETEDLTIELALFSLVDLRQAPPSPVDGRPQKRAALSEVECLLAGV